MSSLPRRSNRRSNILALISKLEERRNNLLSQQRELSRLVHEYNNQSMELGVRIDEVTANIGRLNEEIRQQDVEEEETRHRNCQYWQKEHFHKALNKKFPVYNI